MNLSLCLILEEKWRNKTTTSSFVKAIQGIYGKIPSYPIQDFHLLKCNFSQFIIAPEAWYDLDNVESAVKP